MVRVPEEISDKGTAVGLVEARENETDGGEDAAGAAVVPPEATETEVVVPAGADDETCDEDDAGGGEETEDPEAWRGMLWAEANAGRAARAGSNANLIVLRRRRVLGKDRKEYRKEIQQTLRRTSSKEGHRRRERRSEGAQGFIAPLGKKTTLRGREEEGPTQTQPPTGHPRPFIFGSR